MQAASAGQAINTRYQLRERLGQGGMGVVYRAYDRVVKRDVALKTLRDKPEQQALDLFHRECDVLASISHPNIVEIFDVGEFEDNGELKPYFVMPFLRGATLLEINSKSSAGLTPERSLEIICQTCRGLHAAHERGLIHRDLKPSNIFVLEDDSIKIIDFGIAHMLNARSASGVKGTLFYMSPEQIEMKPLSPASDVFSLAIVAYEILTGRRPFQGQTEAEIVHAILHSAAPAVHELNPSVGPMISRVVHKALAKRPGHRVASARDFAESLHKAARGETVGFVSTEVIRPRIQRASKAFSQGDYQFALEILGGLEAEGYIDTDVSSLRQQIEAAVQTRKVKELIEGARARAAEQEFGLALQKVREARQFAPDDLEALALESEIETRLAEYNIGEWLRGAREDIEKRSFASAREMLVNVLRCRPEDSQALHLLSEARRLEEKYITALQEKEKRFRQARRVYGEGAIDSALREIDAVLDLDRQAPGNTDEYERFSVQLRRENEEIENAYQQARIALEDNRFADAKVICERYLKSYPRNTKFHALLSFVEQEIQRQSGAVREIVLSVQAKVEELKAQGKLEGAAALIEQTLASHAQESSLAALREELREALFDLQRDRQILEQYLQRVRQLQAAGDLRCALSLLSDAIAAYPGNQDLLEMERGIQGECDRAARTHFISHCIDQANKYRAEGNLQMARDSVQEGLAKCRDDLDLLHLQATFLFEAPECKSEVFSYGVAAAPPANPRTQTSSVEPEPPHAPESSRVDRFHPAAPHVFLWVRRTGVKIAIASAVLGVLLATGLTVWPARRTASQPVAKQDQDARPPLIAPGNGAVHTDAVPQEPAIAAKPRANSSRENASEKISAPLKTRERFLKSVQITTDPAGATIEIKGADGDVTCVSPCSSELPSGRYGIVAALAGYRTRRELMYVPDRTTLHLSLEQQQGWVSIGSDAGEPIVVDGRDTGKRTPAVLILPAGKHSISIAGRIQETVEVVDGQLQEFRPGGH